MTLRCLLFSSDEGTAAPVLQVLAGLGVEAEHCSEAVATVEKVTHQNFHIVIIDWDMQPEAALLLTTARERKAAERPLTLAIVSDDASVPQALQAGANSILRKPLLVNQVKDTLTTARDLLRAKQESAATAAQAAAAGASAGSGSTLPVNGEPATAQAASEKTLRAGEFLHAGPSAPGKQFETESDVHQTFQPSSVEPVNPLKDLEPMAASVAHEKPAASTPSAPNEPRGLAWYLKTRAGGLPPVPVQASPSPAAEAAKPELLGYEQTSSQTSSQASSHSSSHSSSFSPAPSASSGESAAEGSLHHREVEEQKHEQKQEHKQEQRKEAELFAYMTGESKESEAAARPRFRLNGAILGALVLASCAIAAAPQAPWHPKLRVAWAHGQVVLRGWLNPQPVTPVQAPAAHEDFGRAGDEYKLPVAETIPDATTDPAQIHVLPVVDPTTKKPNNMGSNAEPAGQPVGQTPGSTPGQVDTTGATPTDQTPPSGTQVPDQPPQSPPETAPAASGLVASGTPPPPSSIVVVPAATVPVHTDPPVVVAPPVAVPVRPAPPRNQEPHYASAPGNVPSSLKSQMASMTPDASGNKPPEAAMQSIEPVSVPELTERALLTDQPALDYPASARGQQGTVVLQVLIGRDGTVQDAKFMQGSLAFARSAIDGVKLWKFKPYAMNGRAVSVQTSLTITFKP